MTIESADYQLSIFADVIRKKISHRIHYHNLKSTVSVSSSKRKKKKFENILNNL